LTFAAAKVNDAIMSGSYLLQNSDTYQTS
jgi:hypothetical protein